MQKKNWFDITRLKRKPPNFFWVNEIGLLSGEKGKKFYQSGIMVTLKCKWSGNNIGRPMHPGEQDAVLFNSSSKYV